LSVNGTDWKSREAGKVHVKANVPASVWKLPRHVGWTWTCASQTKVWDMNSKPRWGDSVGRCRNSS